MKIKLAFLLTCIILADVGHALCQETEITTFILLRHAEKVDNSSDPDLSIRGYERAERLASMLSKTEIAAIYSTNLTRTKETVRTVAENSDMDIQTYGVQTPVETVSEWIDKHRGEIVVVSGHSNTTPAFANALIGREHFSGSFDDSDYGNLLIITLSETGDSKLLHLRY